MKTFLIKDQIVIVDDVDYEVIKHIKWYLLKTKGRNKYLVIGRPFPKKHMLLHRYLYLINHFEIKEGLEIDHINGNGLDNRKENLRAVTHQENILNRHGCQINCKSGAVGVQLMKTTGKYRAYVCINRKFFHIGIFDTKQEASNARNKYIIENKLNLKLY